jgi:hypothetical protein
MINADMRDYDFYLYQEKNAYGQQLLSKEPKGTIKMAVYTTNQSIQDNVNYKNAAYVGITHATIDDTYAIQYGAEKLKVLYVLPQGRYKQVFLAKI